MDRPTLEQLAQITEPQMVRRRFDDHNLVWAYVISWFFALSSFVLVGMSLATKGQRFPNIVISVTDAVFTIFIIAAMTELRRARRRENWEPHAYARIVRRSLAAWIIAVFIVKFGTLMFFALSDSGGWIAWGVIFPMTTIALRLLLPHRIILNAAMLAIAIGALLLSPVSRTKQNKTGILIALVSVNV